MIGNAVTFGSSKGKPQICFRGIWKGFSENVTHMIALLKCFYTNAYSMKHKQEKTQTAVEVKNYDLIASTEIWWDKSHSWNTTAED